MHARWWTPRPVPAIRLISTKARRSCYLAQWHLLHARKAISIAATILNEGSITLPERRHSWSNNTKDTSLSQIRSHHTINIQQHCYSPSHRVISRHSLILVITPSAPCGETKEKSQLHQPYRMLATLFSPSLCSRHPFAHRRT